MIHKLIDYVNKLKKNGMFLKYFKRYTLIFILPFLLTYLLFYCTYMLFAEKDLSDSLNSEVLNLTVSSNNIINNIMNQYYQYSSNKDVDYLLTLNREELYSYENHITFAPIQALLNNSQKFLNYYTDISLFSIKGDYIISSGNSNTAETFTNSSWYKEYKTNQNNNFISCEIVPSTGKEIINLCFPIKNIINDTTGLFIASLDYQALASQLSVGNYENQIKIISGNTIMYSSDFNEIGTMIDTSLIPKNTKPNISFSDSTAVTVCTFYDDSFTLVCTSDISHHLNSVINASMLFLALTILTVIISIAVSIHMSMNFYNSVTDISSHLLFDNSEWAVHEADFVINNINNTILNKKNLEHELAANIIQLKKSQIVALQTQLNPHFIYNTLNAIGLSMNNPRIRSDILIRNFSDILEYSLNTKELLTAVKDEIAYTKRYIEIEEIKYMEKFNIVFSIDEDINELKVLKFMLQPIVENTLRHGFLHHSEEGFSANISADKTDNELIFTITDTGMGIEPERLSEIQHNLNNELFPEAHNIGLYNIHLRIRLIFGKQYGVSIDSEKDKGTTVKITLPIIKTAEIN